MQRSTAMRSLLALSLLVPTFASADGRLDELVDAAHAAAARGDCAKARAFSREIRGRDSDFHAAVVATDLRISDCKQAPVQPPTDDGPHVLRQLLAGVAFSIPGAGTPGFVVYRVAGSTTAGLFAGAIGLVASASVGVIFAGDNAATDYSAVATLLCAATGAGIAGAIVARYDDLGPIPIEGLLLAAVALPTLGAMTGFNLTRQVTPPPPLPPISDGALVVPVLGGSF